MALGLPHPPCFSHPACPRINSIYNARGKEVALSMSSRDVITER